MAVTHFAFGAICMTVIVSYLLPSIRYSRTLVIGSGCWAMVPDFHQIAPLRQSLFAGAHSSIYANLFWFHRIFDIVDRGDSHRFAAVMLGLLLLVTLLAEERLYTPEERVGM